MWTTNHDLGRDSYAKANARKCTTYSLHPSLFAHKFDKDTCIYNSIRHYHNMGSDLKLIFVVGGTGAQGLPIVNSACKQRIDLIESDIDP